MSNPQSPSEFTRKTPTFFSQFGWWPDLSRPIDSLPVRTKTSGCSSRVKGAPKRTCCSACGDHDDEEDEELAKKASNPRSFMSTLIQDRTPMGRTRTGAAFELASAWTKADSNGVVWEIKEIATSNFVATANSYSPPGIVYGDSHDKVSSEIDKYAATHKVTSIFKEGGLYTDINGGIWKEYDRAIVSPTSPFPDPSLPRYVAGSTSYVPPISVDAETEIELKTEIDTYAASHPLKVKAPGGGPVTIPPVIITGDDGKPKVVVPGSPPSPVAAKASESSGGYGWPLALAAAGGALLVFAKG